MAADHHPRYVVREITGYSDKHGSGPQHTSVWVADTWDCWREVATFYTRDRSFGCPPYAPRRATAETRCAELNAEHDAWLAAG
jgi:hypothetical protein